VTRVRLAWALAILTGVAAIADTVMTLESSSFFSEQAVAQHGWPFITAAVVLCSTTGAVIVSRYPRHPIGWLLISCGTVGAISLVAEAWSLWILTADGIGSQHFGHVVGWFSALIGAPLAIALLAFIFLTAPDGRILSPRWRWVGWGIVTGITFYTAGVLLIPPGEVVVNDNQDFGLLSNLFITVGILTLLLGLIGATVALVRRLRHSTGVLHQQLRWIAAAGATIPFGLVWLLVVQNLHSDSQQQWVDSLPLFISYMLFPLSVAIAVLRHRLYDIDVIINRAALLAVATAFVAAGYITLVVLVGGNADGFWTSLLATALVALAFQPLRSRAVRVADRFAYGPRAVPYEALAEFSRRLGESPQPETLLPAVADTAAQAVHARRVIVRLVVAGGPDRVATWPTQETAELPPTDVPLVDIPVVDRDEVLGHIELDLAPGRSLRDRDLTLLHDVADQAAIAFRNAGLTAELMTKVEQLRLRTGELGESRRRLITAADAERQRLERAIARDVAPHLEPLPQALDELARSHECTAGRLEPLVAASSAALEALREITRGVFPAQLVRGGLGPALRSYLGRPETNGHLELHESADRRFDPQVEATAYFCVAEAAQSLGAPLLVDVSAPDGRLELHVSGRSTGVLALAHIRDRVEAAGGSIALRSLDGSTALEVRLPAAASDPPADQQSLEKAPAQASP